MIREFLFALFLFICVDGYTQNNNATGSKPVSMDSLFRAKARESIGKSFPEFMASFNGHLLTNDSLKGKVVFINFWFEACPPCIAEMSALNELYKKFAVNKDFEFISFTYETTGRIRLLREKYHMQYKVASVSQQECYRLNQNNGFPTSIVLDKNGSIKDLFTGGSTDRKEARTFIINTVYQSINEALKN